jgi:hypothetical protein
LERLSVADHIRSSQEYRSIPLPACRATCNAHGRVLPLVRLLSEHTICRSTPEYPRGGTCTPSLASIPLSSMDLTARRSCGIAMQWCPLPNRWQFHLSSARSILACAVVHASLSTHCSCCFVARRAPPQALDEALAFEPSPDMEAPPADADPEPAGGWRRMACSAHLRM